MNPNHLTTSTLPPIDTYTDPGRFYTQPAQAEVYQAQTPDGTPAWVVSRHADVTAILKDSRFSQTRLGTMTKAEKQTLPPLPEFMGILQGSDMLTADAPQHTRLRGLVHKAFTPRLIEGLRPRIEQIANELLDHVEMRSDREMELIEDFALPLPVTVIAELLGLPVTDQGRFQAWTEVLTSQTTFSPESTASLVTVTEEFTGYFADLFGQRRREPKDDLITGLVKAEESGDQLSENELHAMVMLILAAGHETTVNLIGNSVLTLLQHPGELERLRKQPELIIPAVEELLRFVGPVHAGERYAKEEIPFGKVTFQRGDTIVLLLATANRDPERFHNPDTLDLTRADVKHLSFGQGIHFCLGAPLARLEGQIALNALLQRFSDLRLKDAKLERRTDSIVYGLRQLPLLF